MAHEESIEKQAEKEIPLGRSQTGNRSLASEIMEQRTADKGAEKANKYSFLYLFIMLYSPKDISFLFNAVHK